MSDRSGRDRSRGRWRLGSLVLVLPLAVFAGTSWYLARGSALLGRLGARGAPEAAPPPAPEVLTFAGAEEIGGVRLSLRLAPLVPESRAQAARAEVLRARYGLEPGEPFRLEIALASGDGAPDALALGLPRVRDALGDALAAAALPTPAGSGAPADPLAVLYAPRPGPTSVPGAAEFLLWGRAPGKDARAVLPLAGGVREIPLAERRVSASSLLRSFLRASSAEPGPEVDPRDERIASLEAALADERARRRERELAWYEFNRGLAALHLPTVGPGFPVDEELLPEGLVASADEAAEPPEPEPDPDAERVAAMRIVLLALMRSEGIFGYDPLELGALGDGWVGPVVLKILDDRGRLCGSLSAERLRLEGSRAARSLTLVLEDGFESRGGERVPFAGGVRRIELPFVDPDPWQEALPELFEGSALVATLDDGRWEREGLRRELNRLLGHDVSAGFYRVRGIGGVVGDEYVDVLIEVFDSDAHVRERVFADRMRILPESPGIRIELTGGAILKGEQKEPFSDGEHTLFVPRSPLALWEGASLPGWGAPSGAPPRGAPGDGRRG